MFWIILWYIVLVASIFIRIYTKTCFFPEEHQKFIKEHIIAIIVVLILVLIAILADYWYFKGGNSYDQFYETLSDWKENIITNE